MDSMTGKGIDLYEFLVEAELQHYYTSIKSELKIQTVAQLKYATDEDLRLLGLSRPETRRLRKFYDRHCPHGYLSKIKRLLQPPRRDETAPLATVSEERQGTSRPCSTGVSSVPSSLAPGSKHIIPAESISVHKQLGVGEFGIVQQGVWRNGSDRIQVAIKCLSRERMQSHPMEFLKEAAIMHAVDNVHVVRLYGVVLDTDALMLVTELAPLRSLLECLKEPALRSSFTVLTLCEFASQICSGMMYLETKRLIHRDLAARNILVFSKDKVKISDFGLSRALGVGKDYYQTNFNVNLKLPIAWCAPECISYLRFTSLSDVWAYAVTLWEMFSYGFQPWAALTGCQILEAIDEPNYQRLEQPECCPKEYYALMLKCWQHDPLKRPKFSEIYVTLPECKPEQVQTISGTGLEPDPRREQLAYRAGEVITVLDKISNAPLWKGVAPNGKTGLFDPSHTVAYLGALPGGPPNPLANQGTTNGDSKENFMRTADRSSKRRLRTEMISSPQGDLKHTGHVGLDGAYFGDISFFSSGNVNVPRQIVAPYKPSEDLEAPLLPPTPTQPDAPILEHVSNPLHITDHQTLTYRGSGKQKPSLPSLHIGIDDSVDANLRRVKWGDVETSSETHEYHEISDEENAVPESPRFDKTYDMGPSLLDEMESVLRLLGNPRPPPSPADHEGANQRNEIRELSSRLGRSASTGKKKQASVKPISAADQRALDCAIAMANEISARSMTDLECPDPPQTPSSPSRKKFSFRFPSVGGPGQANQSEPPRANFHEEAQSIPDIQSTITEDSRLAYSSLIEQPTPPVDLQACPVVKSAAISGTLPRIPLLQMPLDIAPSRHTLSRFSSATEHADTTGDVTSQLSTSPTAQETNPLRILRSKNFPAVRPRNRNAEKIKPLPNVRKHVSNENADRNSSDLDTASVPESPSYLSNADCNFVTDSAFNYSHPLLNYQNNPVPLPPRDRTKLNLAPSKRHTRKHPLIIPATNLQRTLDKVNQLTPVEDKPPLTFPNVVTDVVDSKQNSSAHVEPGYVNHQEVVLGKQLKYSTQQFLDNNFTPSELTIGSNVVEYENVDMASHDDVDCASLHFENMVESNFNSIDNFHDTSADCSPEELGADKYTKFHDNYVENDKKKYEFCIKHPGYLTKPNELANHALFNKIRNNEINDNMSKNLPIKQIDGLKLDQETLNPFSEQSSGREERGAVDNGDMASCDVTDGMDVGTYSDQALVKTSDHVSCEDLLEFAGQKPRGRARGIESDEVRIMSKVLGPEVTSSHCLLALEFIDWNVHKAIKLARLQSVLGVPSLSLRECRAALEVSQWDVTRAARYVSTDSTSV